MKTQINRGNVNGAMDTCNAQMFIQPLQQPVISSRELGLNASDVTVVT